MVRWRTVREWRPQRGNNACGQSSSVLTGVMKRRAEVNKGRTNFWIRENWSDNAGVKVEHKATRTRLTVILHEEELEQPSGSSKRGVERRLRVQRAREIRLPIPSDANIEGNCGVRHASNTRLTRRRLFCFVPNEPYCAFTPTTHARPHPCSVWYGRACYRSSIRGITRAVRARGSVYR